MKKCMSGCLAACAGIFMVAEVLAKDAVAQDAVGQNRPQIEIEVRILEMSAPLAKGLFGKKGPVPGGDVTDDLQERISQTKGVDRLAAPRVVTRAGQSAQIKMVKEMTFVSSFRIAGTNGVWEPVFKTVEPGIVATVVADPYPNDPGRLHGLVEVSFTQVISFTEQTLTPPGNQGSLRLQTSGSNLVCNSLKSQSPVIENRALTMSFDVGNGKRIVLGSIERSEGDGIKSTVVLFRVRVIPRLP